MMREKRMNVTKSLNESLNIVNKHPVILVIYLIPALISLASGATSLYGLELDADNFENFNFEENGEEFPLFENMFPTDGTKIATSVALGLISSIVSILVGGIAIVMGADAWKGREVGLKKAFDFMKDRWLILIVAAIIIAILEVIGILACCIGFIIVVVLTVFVRQGIMLDGLSLTSAFNASFTLARKVWTDVLVLYIIYIVAGAILSFIPFLGVFVWKVLDGLFTVAFTLYYIDLTKPQVEQQQVVESSL
ncbi:MAG: hypothetical protein ACXQTP_04310 [Candidatus Methanofastidiosia archaeon]